MSVCTEVLDQDGKMGIGTHLAMELGLLAGRGDVSRCEGRRPFDARRDFSLRHGVGRETAGRDVCEERQDYNRALRTIGGKGANGGTA